jgi:hypothetical protein
MEGIFQEILPAVSLKGTDCADFRRLSDFALKSAQSVAIFLPDLLL